MSMMAPEKEPGKRRKALNVCMLVVGTHGDVLPFLAIGQILAKDGHRVRVATHEMFQQQVEDRGLEFFSIGADPLQMSEFMVKHKSLMISNPLKAIPALSDLPKQLKLAKEILANSWPAVCSENFRADAVIANPICWGHVHVAEKLEVPLHIMFPQPWLPTKEYPHPYSGWKFGGPPNDRNVYSYSLMDAVMWLPIHSAVNKFRKETLQLPTLSLAEGMAGLLRTRMIPHSFLWSESLVPFPSDWPKFADIVGCIHNPADPYTPSKKLAAFLKQGPPPILVTFGSMRIQAASQLGQRIRAAAKKSNVRVLVQSGWSDLSAGVKKDPLLFHIRACPHTWLLPNVAAAVHHGGAGTTHAVALAGKPQLICPFFGDQPFWGEAAHKAGVGLSPVPIDKLTERMLSDAFVALLSGDMQSAAEALAAKMKEEDGASTAAKSFYRGLAAYQKSQQKLRRQQSSLMIRKSQSSPIVKLKPKNPHLVNTQSLPSIAVPAKTGKKKGKDPLWAQRGREQNVSLPAVKFSESAAQPPWEKRSTGPENVSWPVWRKDTLQEANEAVGKDHAPPGTAGTSALEAIAAADLPVSKSMELLLKDFEEAGDPMDDVEPARPQRSRKPSSLELFLRDVQSQAAERRMDGQEVGLVGA